MNDQPSTVKHCIQSGLRKLGVRERLRETLLYDVYWSIADRSLLDDRRKELDFYRSLLQGLKAGDVIFDIGANQGHKTRQFLSLGARVVAVEPDELNQAILHEKFLKFRLIPKPVVLVAKAVSDKSAVEQMWIDGPGSAMNSFSRKWVDSLRADEKRFGHRLEFSRQKEVPTTTVEDLALSYGTPFFVKIDVEGYELHVLRGMKRPVPYLSFEVNLPEFKDEGKECIEVLQHLAAEGKFNYAVDCRDGLALPNWLDAPEFSRVFDQCADTSVEVFWKTPLAVGRT